MPAARFVSRFAQMEFADPGILEIDLGLRLCENAWWLEKAPLLSMTSLL